MVCIDPCFTWSKFVQLMVPVLELKFFAGGWSGSITDSNHLTVWCTVLELTQISQSISTRFLLTVPVPGSGAGSNSWCFVLVFQ